MFKYKNFRIQSCGRTQVEESGSTHVASVLLRPVVLEQWDRSLRYGAVCQPVVILEMDAYIQSMKETQTHSRSGSHVGGQHNTVTSSHLESRQERAFCLGPQCASLKRAHPLFTPGCSEGHTEGSQSILAVPIVQQVSNVFPVDSRSGLTKHACVCV